MKEDLFSYTHVYFLGIGGIGMSALAQYFHHYGKKVAGYDKTPSSVTNKLQSMGIDCYYEENPERLGKFISETTPDKVLIVYTPAVPADHKELCWLQQNNYTIHKRSQVLGNISCKYKTIAVAGTHGKTTTTTFITHLLYSSGIPVLSFMGGISANYGTNLLLPDSSVPDNEIWMVAEADEYDRSFLYLHPYYSVITSVDPDHLDIYGNENIFKEGFREFASLTKKALIVNKNVENEFKFFPRRYTYSINLSSTCCVRSLQTEEGITTFCPEAEEEKYPCMQLHVPGRHNVENVLAGIMLGNLLKIDPGKVKYAVETFRGVERRFDVRFRNENCIYIDDYAHHPSEIEATLRAVREYYPGQSLRVIFQPHLFSRTRDFLDGFAKSLGMADEVWLLDIYPAREIPIPGITSSLLLEKIPCRNKKLLAKEEVIKEVLQKPTGITMTMGAGDIDRLVPLLEAALKKYWKIN
jgi:UDP-N-acetylmuramate--alanine ligase